MKAVKEESGEGSPVSRTTRQMKGMQQEKLQYKE